MRIVTAPHQILSHIAKPVGNRSKNVPMLVEEMKKILLATNDPQGVGLAGPQVGESLRIFIAKPTDTSPIQVFINPEIISQTLNNADQNAQPRSINKDKFAHRSARRNAKLEGCLSLPSIWGIVNRYPKLTLSYEDENGKKRTKLFSGFMATIVQHEIDHLNGILFPKRVLEQKQKLFKSHKDKEGEDEFDEIEI